MGFGPTELEKMGTLDEHVHDEVQRRVVVLKLDCVCIDRIQRRIRHACKPDFSLPYSSYTKAVKPSFWVRIKNVHALLLPKARSCRVL